MGSITMLLLNAAKDSFQSIKLLRKLKREMWSILQKNQQNFFKKYQKYDKKTFLLELVQSSSPANSIKKKKEKYFAYFLEVPVKINAQ